MFEKVVYERLIPNLRLNGFELLPVKTLTAYRESINFYRAYLVLFHHVNKIGVTDFLRVTGDIEILKNDKQNSGYDDPKRQVFNHVVQELIPFAEYDLQVN